MPLRAPKRGRRRTRFFGLLSEIETNSFFFSFPISLMSSSAGSGCFLGRWTLAGRLVACHLRPFYRLGFKKANFHVCLRRCFSKFLPRRKSLSKFEFERKSLSPREQLQVQTFFHQSPIRGSRQTRRRSSVLVSIWNSNSRPGRTTSWLQFVTRRLASGVSIGGSPWKLLLLLFRGHRSLLQRPIQGCQSSILNWNQSHSNGLHLEWVPQKYMRTEEVSFWQSWYATIFRQ